MQCHNTKYSSKCDCCLHCILEVVNWSWLFLGTPRSPPAIQVSLPVALWACWGQHTSPNPGVACRLCILIRCTATAVPKPLTRVVSGRKEQRVLPRQTRVCCVWEIAGCNLARKIGCHVRRILGSYFRNSPRPFSSSGFLCIVRDNPFSLLNAK